MATKTVEFKFDIDDEVFIKRTDEKGTVTMCALDDGGNKYYVQTKDSCTWWAERLLDAPK